MSYLRYLCLFAHSDVQHIFVFFFAFFCLSSSCVSYVSSFSGLSFFDCSFDILQRVFVVQISTTKLNKYIVLPNDLYLLVICTQYTKRLLLILNVLDNTIIVLQSTVNDLIEG